MKLDFSQFSLGADGEESPLSFLALWVFCPLGCKTNKNNLVYSREVSVSPRPTRWIKYYVFTRNFFWLLGVTKSSFSSKQFAMISWLPSALTFRQHESWFWKIKGKRKFSLGESRWRFVLLHTWNTLLKHQKKSLISLYSAPSEI